MSQEHVAVEIMEIENSLIDSLQTLGRKKNASTIYKVPNLTRSEDFDPKVIAIGPLHHGTGALEPMEAMKSRYMRQLLKRNTNPAKRMVQNYINTMYNDVTMTRIRSFYPELLSLDGKTLVGMMVLDGCFLIEFLIKAYVDERSEHPNEMSWNHPLLRRDLLLLENQIPFFVLQLLFDSSDFEFKHEVTLINFVVSFVSMYRYQTLPKVSDNDTVHHLLHALHASLLTPAVGEPRYSDSVTKKAKQVMKMATIPFLLLLSCIVTCRVPYRRTTSGPKETSKMMRRIYTATQLYEFGVTDMSRFLDVTFDKEEGVIEVPEW